jgi:fatty-acyl-CoA synthase
VAAAQACASSPAHWRFWPAGVPHEAQVPRTTLPAALAAAAAESPDKAAIVYGGAITTYAQLQQRVQALAGWLQQRLGVQPGDRVLVIGQNGPQWVAAAYAVLRAGAVLVPVNPMSKAAEIAFHAQDSGARVAIVAQELLPQLALGDGEGQIAAALVWAYADAIAANAAEEMPDWVRAPAAALHDARLHAFEAAVALDLHAAALPDDPDALAVLPYTSGTTGKPKACMHTHATLLASLAASAVWKRLHRASVVLTVAPLFHMLGLQNGMNLPILLGATAVMMPRWHAETAAALIERHRVTAWSAPPAMVLDLFAAPDTAARDLSSLVFLSGGGAAMPEAVAQMLQRRYGLNYEEAYGLTESASFLHANPPQRCKPQCLGIPTQGVDSRVVDPATLQQLPPGEVGELITHAPQLMLGYWRNEAADRAAFVTLDGRRFFRTGDLATVDEDGYFFLKDRLKRMINVSGYKVWPAEVENVLYAHPAVHEACVVAVPDPRAGKCGEAVKAIVVLKPGLHNAVDAAAFLTWCRAQMAVYKAPRSVEFVAALPKSAAGKVLWRELQQAQQAQQTQQAQHHQDDSSA